MYRVGVVFICWAVFVTSGIEADSFPSDVQRCTFSDSDCISATVTQILQTHYKNGHRGLNIIPFDPLHIKSLVLEKIPNSPVNVEFAFKDIDLTGLSRMKVFKVTGFTKEPSNLVFQLHANLPELILTGPYKVDGKVLILPIVGQGNSKIIFKDTTVIAKVKCETVEKDGQIYLHIVKIHLNLEPANVRFYLENLFNGDKALGDNMITFLNDNWKEMYSEMKPLIGEAIGKIVIHIANGAFLKIPYTDLFLPS